MTLYSDEFKVPAGVARWPDGEAILVLRPQNAPLVLALGKIAVEHDSLEALREACTSGPMTFMGFLKRMTPEEAGWVPASGSEQGTKKKGKKEYAIVDENGENPQPLKAGDTFASRHELSTHPPES
jgi:hypothetical protein